MLRKIIFYGIILMGGFSIVSCSKDEDADSESGEVIETGTAININSASTKGTAEGSQETGADEEDLVANSSFSSTVKINFDGNSATIENSVSGVTITQSSGDVVVNCSATGVAYELSGTTTNGSIKIYSDKKFKVTLNGVSITNNDGPAINIQSGKRAFIVVADGTENKLTDAATYATSTEDQKGTIFSEGQLIFSGTGTLTISGKAKHAIASDDYIRIVEGNIIVSDAISDGLHSNDGIYIDGGKLNIVASSDGIEAEKGVVIVNGGEITLKVADDGIVASYEDGDETIIPDVIINEGKINIETTGSGGEGIESKATLSINSGEIYIKAIDDAINAGKAININGGTIVAYSTTNDGIDSNGTMTITGGHIFAIGAKSPEEGFDCDNNTFKITGGLMVGVGGATSSPTASVSTQPSAILSGGNASQIYSILNKDNKEILTFKSPVSFSTLLVSNGGFTVGESYKLVSVSSVEDANAFNGLYLSGNFSNPTVSSSFTLSAMVSNLGGSTGPGGGR
ncbi:carbohydrate-binding domain-containing protein [Sphingobacterium siyangense]|nr:carbohydrate-binding domain-containing protein [Sphingobacterium siyangense]